MKEAQKITCVNNSGFAVKFQICYLDNSSQTRVSKWNSGNFPTGQNRTCDLKKDIPEIQEGSIVWPHILAIIGKSTDGDKVKFKYNLQAAVYIIKDTDNNFHIDLS